MKRDAIDRRGVVLVGAAAGLSALAAACGEKMPAKGAGEKGEKGEEVTPSEDLMREHGVLRRILLVYEEGARRIESPQAAGPLEAINQGAAIVRTFIEDYHEKLEEEHLFPRFEKAGKLVPLVTTLRRQHEVGRKLTDEIRALSTPAAAKDQAQQKRLVAAIQSFSRMYRPHAAHEDTVLFPALAHLVGHKELEELGEKFEEREHQLFGKEGFEGVVAQLAKLEAQAGVGDLDSYTPR